MHADICLHDQPKCLSDVVICRTDISEVFVDAKTTCPRGEGSMITVASKAKKGVVNSKAHLNTQVLSIRNVLRIGSRLDSCQ